MLGSSFCLYQQQQQQGNTNVKKSDVSPIVFPRTSNTQMDAPTPQGSQAVSYTATALLAVFVSRGPRGPDAEETSTGPKGRRQVRS